MTRIVKSLLLVALVGFPAVAYGGTPAKTDVQSLLKDLKSSDYEEVWHAARELGNFPQFKAQIGPALLDALNRDWSQCSGDIREEIALSLGRLMGKDAVFPLLKLLQSGKNVAHECAECGCCFLAQTPGDVIAERDFDPFCENSLLAVINQQADFSHSKAMADLVTQGKWKPELLITNGKVAPPRYAHFISRHKDDPEVDVRIGVARGLGLIDNDQVSIPVLIQLLTRSGEEFSVKWEASKSLIAIGRRGKTPSLKGRLVDLLRERDKTTVILAARALALLGEKAGPQKLRELAGDGDIRIRSDAVLYLGEASDADAKEVLLKRLEDESLTVRAFAMYGLGRIGDASTVPVLNKAFDAANEYQEQLAKRLKSGESEAVLRERYGYGYDVRQTLQEAVDTIGKRVGHK
jgi:HEAT repeat protein